MGCSQIKMSRHAQWASLSERAVKKASVGTSSSTDGSASAEVAQIVTSFSPFCFTSVTTNVRSYQVLVTRPNNINTLMLGITAGVWIAKKADKPSSASKICFLPEVPADCVTTVLVMLLTGGKHLSDGRVEFVCSHFGCITIAFV